MPHCPHSKDCSLAAHLCPSGTWVISCPRCLYTYTSTTKDYYLSRYMFWEHHDNLPKETEMSQVTSDYRRGVEDAGRKILEEMPLSGITDPVDVLNAIPRFLRKSLLTKKVMKWFAVYNNGGSGQFRISREDIFDFSEDAKSKLFDTEQEALERIKTLPYPVGAFPVETIVEL